MGVIDVEHTLWRWLESTDTVNSKMSLHQFDPVIAKLTRMIMKDGKKHCALRILDDCFTLLRTKHSIQDPASFTRNAVELAKPVVEVRKYVVGGRTIHVPAPCRPNRQESLALRFIRYVDNLSFLFLSILVVCVC